MRTAFRAEIEAVASQFHLDADLVEAVVLVESSGQTDAFRFEPGFWQRYMKDKPQWDGANPRRVSASYGLMQCMYTTALEHGFAESAPEYLFVPTVGLHWGCAHLRSLLDWSHGNVDQALAAYNGGKTGNTEPPYRNQAYVNHVKHQLARIQQDRMAIPEGDT
jgi:soluble lytic murein transglycosylase-like protein